MSAAVPHPDQPPPARIKGWRKWAIRLALVVGGPAFFLAICEALLWGFGVGYDSRFWVYQPAAQNYAFNDKFTWRFAPRPLAPTTVVSMTGAKKPGTVRIFVLGESAVQGIPDPAYSFSRILEVMLAERFPATEFEIINTGITAINSNVILPIAQECAKHQPDMFIIYMGNNEVLGPFGPATVFNAYTPSLGVIRASLRAKSFRLGQFIESLSQREGQAASGTIEFHGMESFSNNRIPAEDPRREVVYSHFRANLSEILSCAKSAGAKTLVCTIGCNLRDCAPFGSAHRPGISADDLKRFEIAFKAGVDAQEKQEFEKALGFFAEALAVDDHFAELFYRAALCNLSVKQPGRARELFIKARDFDSLQFRTDSRQQEIIRELSRESETSGVFLVDIDAEFQKRAADGIPGAEFFWEHVHPRFSGDYVIAEMLAAQVEQALPESIRKTAAQNATPTLEQCESRLALTAFDKRRSIDSMLAMMSRPPFTTQIGASGRQNALIAELKAIPLSRESLVHGKKLYEDGLERNPDDFRMRFNYSVFLSDNREYAKAAEQLNAISSVLAENPKVKQGLANLLTLQGKPDEAVPILRNLLESQPSNAAAHKALGDAFMIQGKVDDAVREYRDALRLAPNFQNAHINLAAALNSQKGQHDEEAISEYTKALEISPNADAFHGLAQIYMKQGKTAEAFRNYQKACELNPSNPAFRANFGAALLTQKKTNEASEQLSLALKLDPKFGKAHALLGQIHGQRQDFTQAIRHFRAAIENGHATPQTLSALAWLLATHPDPAQRNAADAVKFAEDACKQTAHNSPSFLDILAAAYADAGRFDDAVRTASLALQLLSGSNHPAAQQQADSIRQHISVYSQRRALHP